MSSPSGKLRGMASGDPRIDEGIYESLLTDELRARLVALNGFSVETRTVDDADEPAVLARHVRLALVRALESERNRDRRQEIVNDLLALVDAGDEKVTLKTEQLMSVRRPAAPGRQIVRSIARPATPLSDAALLTNAHGEPALGHELRAELATANRVDLLCAFVKWHGLRLLERELKELREHGVPLRVITTTYIGGTERAALDRLVRDFGADVRVQYDARRTRLHAKAWLFTRDTGFDTGYVGSSNLTRAALLDGVEWNVRISSVATPGLLEKFRATFETYWNDPSFEPYDPDTDADRLDDALAAASGRGTGPGLSLTLSGLEVRPYAYQSRMLEQLDVERTVHDRHRNLVVAATGTGKTVVAALDYRRLAFGQDPRPTLLFVAHRKEILEQSLRTYREVLADAGFGELHVDGRRPERWRHVFASVQSLTAYGVDRLPADAFDIVVIDEFHHAQASTYRRILDRLRPTELLGLTATPERGDGVDVREFFDGRSAAELRLWDALSADLLTPFHYFGVSDGTDLSRVDWKQGNYDVVSLSNLYTGHTARAQIILKSVRDKVSDLHRMKALGFCVSVDHARFMTSVFNEAGIPAAAVLGETAGHERTGAIADLREGRIKAIFTVDVFNEGVDVPAINTILFLRPTESATVFLQQLGRGLRTAEGKAVLTALDFVGHQRTEFRFDRRYRALTGSTRTQLVRDIEHGFPFLPPGTQIVLDEHTQREVLDHVKAQVTATTRQLVGELRAHPTPSLQQFLSDSGADLADVIRDGRSWTAIKRTAGISVPPGATAEVTLLKRVRAFAHVDDPQRAAHYLRWLSEDPPHYDQADPLAQHYGRMLFFSLWPDGGGFESYADGLSALAMERNVRADLREVIALGLENAEHVTFPLDPPLNHLPLRVHARYSREEAVAALDYADVAGRKPNSFREGVLFSAAHQADGLFVTLKKSESDYSPTTLYRDYAISRDQFHWESQSVTTVRSPTGQRYIHHREMGTHVLLFAREAKNTSFGGGAPYLFLGTADYVEHRGERPMAITWRLSRPMPSSHFAVASVVA